MKTLIVEDDLASQLVLHSFLSRYGECHIAVNGREAVEAVLLAREKGPKYDLICMDIMMPEMDGQAAVRAIRRQEANAHSSAKGSKIIMTTALSDPENVRAAFQGQCDAYLKKPIDLARLTEEMKSLGLI